MEEEQCLECGGKDGMHALCCRALDDREIEPAHYGHETVAYSFSVSQEAQSESLVFASISGFLAGSKGEPRSAPEGLSEDAAWTWLSAYDRAAKEMVDRRQAV